MVYYKPMRVGRAGALYLMKQGKTIKIENQLELKSQQNNHQSWSTIFLINSSFA